MSQGDAFFAISGLRANGNDYVNEAVKEGAKVIVTDDKEVEVPSTVVKVHVKDARKTLAKYAKRYFWFTRSSSGHYRNYWDKWENNSFKLDPSPA